jgi:hypothetical protein
MDPRIDPKPDPAPVTIAVLPASDNAIVPHCLGRFTLTKTGATESFHEERGWWEGKLIGDTS